MTYSDRKQLRQDAVEALTLIDLAYSKLYGTVPLTQAMINQTIENYIPLLNLDFVCSIKDNDGKIVSFGVAIPSIAQALKDSNGKLLPFGIVRIMKALRCQNDVLELFLVAVEPSLQKFGLPILMFEVMLQNLIKNDVKYCETGPMLETNTAVHSLWRHFEKEQHKRRRCYHKEI